MTHNRRRSHRLPVGFYADQMVDDDPHRCFVTDLSAIGLYMERVAEPLQRGSGVVQVQIPLPNTGESLWAGAEVIYDRVDALFHGTALRFTAMARTHQRLLREWLRASQKRDRFYELPPPRRARQVRIVRPRGLQALAA